MPHFDIIRKAQPAKTFRVASVMGTFDLQDNLAEEHFVGDITPPHDWQIGLIVGRSGTGKTTIAKELFPDAYVTQFEYTHESILDDMPEECSVVQIEQALSSVGFASVPSWLKPYAVLSNGEKMRVDLARAMLQPQRLFVFDEFTSVVDRNVAKVGSFAMQKAIRKTDKQFIAVTCHDDVEDWLLPDWVFDTNSMTFRVCEGQKKNRPACELRIYETKRKQYYWNIFAKYHYLSHLHNNAARVFVATLNGQICGFLSLVHHLGSVKNLWRVHRLVVLPDYQGIGVARYLLEYIGGLLKTENKRLTITTSSASAISMLKRSNKFSCVRIGRNEVNHSKNNGKTGKFSFASSSSCSRITARFNFV